MVPGLAAVLIALVLSPFACRFPDGLEWVAGRFGFLHEAAPAFTAPLAGYSFYGALPGGVSTALAALAGVLAVFALACAIAPAWNPPRVLIFSRK